MPDFAPSPPLAPKKRLLIVDDHPIMRRGLQQLLDLEPDLVVAAQAPDAPQALHALRTQSFDLVVLDISLRGVSGIDVIKDIRAGWPKLPVLMLSMHDESLYAERALRAGARGYVMKATAAEHIIEAIHCVLAGKLYVSAAIEKRLAASLAPDAAEANGTHEDIRQLSDRELEVFRFIGRGWSTRDIAAEMHVSVKTVETYRAHIKQKLRLHSAPDLMRCAVQWSAGQGNN